MGAQRSEGLIAGLKPGQVANGPGEAIITAL